MFKHLKSPPFMISEIGINHNSSMSNVKKLINLAKKYNFDAVKFQKRNPDISTPENQKQLMRDTPWGYISYLDYKKKLNFRSAITKKLTNAVNSFSQKVATETLNNILKELNINEISFFHWMLRAMKKRF
jgi:hypothetical protein